MRTAIIRCLLALAISEAVLGAEIQAAQAGQHKNISSPIPFHAPWTNGVTFKMITYFGRGGHSDASSNYYATDWVRKGAACQETGDPILAPAPGVVTFVQHSDVIGSGGNLVVIQFDANDAVTMWFEHLDQVDVSEKQHVNSADQIGTLGHTGLDAGNCAHLHIGVYEFINNVDYSIKPGPLDGQRVVPGATITSHNNGSTLLPKPKGQKPRGHNHQPHGRASHHGHGPKHGG